MGYRERCLNELIETETEAMTVKAFLAKIRRIKANVGKDRMFLSVYGNDRQMVIKELILSLPKGGYTLNRINSLHDKVVELYGCHASVSVDQKVLTGLSVEYPEYIGVSFTLGLDSITIK